MDELDQVFDNQKCAFYKKKKRKHIIQYFVFITTY